jgi:hypothetical protein
VGIGITPFNKMTINTGTGNNLDFFDTGSSFGLGMQAVNGNNTAYKSWDFYASKFSFFNGNVLIGTGTDNGNKLQVSGGASFSNAISPNGGVFALGDILTTTGRLLASNGSQGANTETASLLLGNRGYFSTSDIGAAKISAVATGTFWYSGTALAFYTNPGPDVTSTSAVERMRIAANGSVSIVGSLSKGSGSFKIDHPLPLKKDTPELYQDQLNLYTYLLHKNGYETGSYAYILFYYPLTGQK